MRCIFIGGKVKKGSSPKCRSAVTVFDWMLRPSAFQPTAAAASLAGPLSAPPSPLARARLEVR